MSSQLSTGKITAELNGVFKNVLTDLTEVQATVGERVTLTLTDGTTTNKVNRGFMSKTRALSAASSETLDLFDLAAIDIGSGAGRDLFGLQVNAIELVGLLVVNIGGGSNTGTLRFGGEGSTAAWQAFIRSDTAYLDFPAPSFMLIGCGADPAWTIADTSDHLLKITAITAAISYSIHWLTRDA